MRARYKFDIYNAGVNATTGSIAFTIQTSQMDMKKGPPSIGGFLVRPTQGAVESQPWTFHVLDVNSTVLTAKLANSSGRPQLIGRLLRAQVALDSTAAYNSVAVGRISDISLNPEVASYGVSVTDERWIERQLMIFTQLDDSLSFMPGGLVKNAPASLLSASPNSQWTCVAALGNLRLLKLTDAIGQTNYDVPVRQFMLNDLVTDPSQLPSSVPITNPSALTKGFWKHLRWRNNATAADFEITSFGAVFGAGQQTPMFPNDPQYGLHLARYPGAGLEPYIWLVWTASPPAVGAIVNGYVHASGATPTKDVPLFVGGTNGFHPGHLTRLICTGTYSTGSLNVRISTGSFNAWEADPTYGTVWFRSTGPQVMSDFLEKRIYQPYAMVPVLDSSGKIAPVSVLAPLSSQAAPASMIVISSTNATIHPTWQNQSREVVNALTMTFESFGRYIGFLLNAPGGTNVTPHYPTADKLAATTQSFRQIYNTSTTLGRREITVRYGGVSSLAGSFVPLSTAPVSPPANTPLARMANSMFQRFGNGPVYTDVTCQASIDNSTLGRLNIGKFCKVKIPTYPNMGTQARGSTRIMQVLRRLDPLGTPQFTLLDFGVSTGPLPTPNVSALALSSISSRHAIKATVSGLSVGVGSGYELQVAGTSTGAAAVPAANSSAWRIRTLSTQNATTSIVSQVFFLASERKWWVQARSIGRGRINSAWSTAKNVVTASIPNPTSEVFISTAGGAATVKWKPGSTFYRTDVHVNDSSAMFTPATSNFVLSAPPGTTRAYLTGFTLGHKARVLLRHGDIYGGYDVGISAVLTPGSTVLPAAPAMKGIIVVIGLP